MIYPFVLVAFIKLLLVTESPRLVAGLYTAIAGIGAIVAVVAGEMNPAVALLTVALQGAIAFAYLYSLIHLKPGTGTWWIVVVVGALLMAAI